jgi:site-specific DNA recombinase
MATVTVISPVTGKPVEHKRVAAYCRVSTNSADQQNSYNTQVRYYTRYIKSRTEWTLVDIFADEGLSGTSSEKRENFQRMITMCELKQIDLVVTKSVSRFARNVKETLEYVRKLKLLGIGVVFEKEGINTISMGDEMLLNTFAAIAQEESVSISQNVRFSIKKKMESGEHINGCVPFGYRLENKVMIPFEPEAEIVRSLFQGYLNGASLTELCRYLEKQSISPRSQGAKWNVRVVSKMLSNEKYIGDSLYQKKYRETTVPFTQHINYGQEEQYYATGTHEGIVDKEIFASVQELLKKRRELYSRPEVAPAKYPFTHRIQCSECGTFYRRRIVNGSVVWGCNQHIEDRTACDSHYYREDRVMDAFIGIINRLRFAEEGIIAESIELTEKAILLKKRNNLQALESSQSMAELNAKLLMLEQLKSKGYLAPDVFESQSREINGQINEIKTKRIQSLSSALDVALNEFKTLQARLNEIDEPLDSFDPKLFEEVIKGMTVNNRDEMTFRLIGDLTFTVRL